jgi:hypothetical protein
MADYALVVGIERYETPVAKTLQGPSLDAVRFALWLCQEQKVPAANIVLILNRTDWRGSAATIFDQTVTKVKGAGVAIREDPSRLAIMKAWREELLSGPEEPGILWLYWSGHGLTFPPGGEAVLCADLELKDPSYIFLSEFRDSLRSETYQRFRQQRLIVDACAEYLKPDDLNITSFRSPSTWAITEAPDQVELNAVAVGSTAKAEEGGSLFSRILFGVLKKSGWPKDPRDLHHELEKGIRGETRDESKQPRVRIFSPRFEAGIEAGDHAAECGRLLEMLWKCEIPFESYQPAYMRTMGSLSSDPQILSPSTLTAMIRELLQLKREADFGDRSLGIVEFFERVRREFKGSAAPIEEWLKNVPAGAMLNVSNKLDQESLDLVLTVLVRESAANRDGFPVSLRADLSDANFSSTILKWGFYDVKDPSTLESQARIILTAADSQARRQKGAKLSVQVFANPPLMGLPWHAYRIDPEDEIDCAAFGQLHSFVLRSRARLTRAAKYDLDSWKQKARALRLRPCGQIPIAKAPSWNDEIRQEVNDLLATVDGLLVISDTLDAPSVATEGLYKLLSAALRRGLPLASWPIAIPGTKRNTGADFAEDLKKLFQQCGSLAQTPEHFRNARKSEPWARHTVLFWDDDDADKLLSLIGEEPSQL